MYTYVHLLYLHTLITESFVVTYFQIYLSLARSLLAKTLPFNR